MIFGFGKYSYKVEEGWLAQAYNQEMGWIPAVACDSKDNVYVFSRNDHPIRLIGLGVRLREEAVTEAQLNFLDTLGI